MIKIPGSITDNVRELAKKNPFLQRLVRDYRLQHCQPKWKPLLHNNTAWKKAIDSSTGGAKILIATTVGGYLAGTTLESLLAVALTLRRANVHVLLCDKMLPACFLCRISWYPNQARFAKAGPKHDICDNCFNPAAKMFNNLGITIHKYSQLLSKEDKIKASEISKTIPFHEIPQYCFDNIKAGEHAMAGALRFYARGDLKEEAFAEPILRRYLQASLLTTFATRRLLSQFNYDCAVFNHGIYVPQGLIGDVCRSNGTRVVNWTPGYRQHSFIFSHNDTYHHTMITEPTDSWENLNLTENIDNLLTRYLKNRWYGNDDWIWFHEQPTFEFNKFARKYKIGLSKPSIGLLTSVMWDAKLHYRSNAFPDMLSWVLKSIEYFCSRKELQLIIRIHPAEIRGTLPSRQHMWDEIKKVYPKLPENIIVILPEDRISTYAVMEKCDTVIIYNTKMGIELSATGIPVIVAGEAWIRNKGFSMDAQDQKTYIKLLDQLPAGKKLPKEKTARARKYAFHFFFRRMIPLEFTKPTNNDPPFCLSLNSIDELLPGKSPGLDIICNGIMHGSEFIYPKEIVAT